MKWIALAFAPTVLGVAACATTQSIATTATGGEITDQAVNDAVENEIRLDPMVADNTVTAVTRSGVVTLEGDVDNLLARERAVDIAGTIEGVVAIVDRITVSPPRWPRTDGLIATEADNALVFDPATESYEIDVEVNQGHATLTGTVDSWAEKSLAATVVKGVRGIVGLTNDLQVRVPEQRPDIEIAAEIEQRLSWDALVDARLIEVGVANGAAVLTGIVGSAAERSRARSSAWVTGVTAVDVSGLDVQPWARATLERESRFRVVTSAELEHAVERALQYDPRVVSANVSAEVNAGLVQLRGTVSSLREKRAAADDARNTVGVVAVDNRLRVRHPDVSETAMVESVQDALARVAGLDASDVHVSADRDVVTLSGAVQTLYDKAQAGQVASTALGVTRVQNNLDVHDRRAALIYEPYLYPTYPYDLDWYHYRSHPTFKSDAAIEHDVNEGMAWSPYVDSDEVDVSVDAGVVTLSGTVETASAMYAAVENALEGGATWVDNDLIITP